MSLSTTIDTLLDRSIALGYGSLGLVVRERLRGWAAELPRMDGRVVLVTGAASGLGLASAQGFARLGASVHALARSDQRAADAVRRVTAAVPGADVRPVACDISSLEALRAFALRFAEQTQRLDVLVNNAGMMPDERRRSVDGHELMFATHVLAPFALTELLRDLLIASAPSRVINVSSGGMYSQRLPSGDLQSDQAGYGPKKLYARTKREEVAISERWAQELRGTGVVVHSMHPGWVDTEGVRNWMPVFRAITRPIIRDPDQGADTILWLGAAEPPMHSSGQFWHDRRPRPTRYRLGAPDASAQEREELWRYCRTLLQNAGITADG
jgi:NAD(P)-dependent dehydrogenase (short-subunit alcohol dehydrogenase family)